jgi:site-specific DNA recombinase
MDPVLSAVFVDDFTAVWNRLQAEASAGLEGRRAELGWLDGRIQRAVDAILAGRDSPALSERLAQFEARRAVLAAELEGMAAPAPRLRPNLAELYRRRMGSLVEALAGEDVA